MAPRLIVVGIRTLLHERADAGGLDPLARLLGMQACGEFLLHRV